MAKKSITGVTLQNGLMQWSTYEQAKSGYLAKPLQETLVPDAESADEQAGAWSDACKEVEGPVVIAVRSQRVLMRVADLPTTEPHELQGMVELQVDKFAPFPIDQMAISYEVLSTEEQTTRVLIAAVQNQVVNEAEAFYRSAGLHPRWIDLELLGYWQLIQSDAETAGFQMHVIVDRGAVDLIVASGGAPVLCRSLTTYSGEEADTTAEEIGEETAYTLTSLETEWGISGTPTITLWHRGDVPLQVSAALMEVCGTNIATRLLDELPSPAEGIAERRTRAGEGTMDLAPPAWGVEADTKQFRRKITIGGLAVIGLWLVVVTAMSILFHSQRSGQDKLKTTVAQIETPADEVRRIERKVRSLQQYSDRSYSALECLREITSVLPQGVDLTNFDYRKASKISLSGESASANQIYNFFSALEGSKLFSAVEDSEVQSKMTQGTQIQKFRVTLILPEEES